MYKLEHVGITYGNRPNKIDDIALCDTVNQCFERLREHLRKSAEQKIELSKRMEVPDCIVRLAKRNIRKNPYLQFEVREVDDEEHEPMMIFIDGQCPEMDYFRIVEFGPDYSGMEITI